MIFIIALIVAIPIIILPVALIWYINVSGLYQVLKDVRARRVREAKRQLQFG